MVIIEHVNPGTPVAGPYTPVVKAGNLLFVSGQIADQGIKDIGKQAINTLEKIKHLLQTCNATVENLVKMNIYLSNIDNFQEMNEAYKNFFLSNGVKEKFPARTTVQAQPALKGFDIEIDAIAIL